MLESLNRYFGAWLMTIRSIFTWSALWPFMALAAIQGMVLWFLAVAPSAAFGGWPIEILRPLFGPAAGHYPGHFVLLPYMFFRSAIIIYGIVGIIAYAIATGGFARRFTGEWEGPRGITATALSRLVPLFVIWLVTAAVVLFGIAKLPHVLADWTYGSPRREIFVEVATRATVILFLSIWAYTTVSLVFERASFLYAIKVSIRRFLRYPLATFFLLGIPYAFTVPFSLFASKSEYLARQFRPETVVIALALVIASQFVANVLTCGTITHYYLGEPARE